MTADNLDSNPTPIREGVTDEEYGTAKDALSWFSKDDLIEMFLGECSLEYIKETVREITAGEEE